jgi:hypothetical protein
MADEAATGDSAGPPKLIPAPVSPGAQLVPSAFAGHVLMTAGVGEVSIMFGQTRLQPILQGAQNSAMPFVEWFVTMSLSPQTALQLRDNLNIVLDQYEKNFGPIPKQPSDFVPTSQKK